MNRDAIREEIKSRLGGAGTLDLSDITPTGDMTDLFNVDAGYYTPAQIAQLASMATFGIAGWDTSDVTSMKSMFRGASAFNETISSWDTSNVTDFSYMFYNAVAFNQPIDTVVHDDGSMSWDVSGHKRQMAFTVTSYSNEARINVSSNGHSTGIIALLKGDGLYYKEAPTYRVGVGNKQFLPSPLHLKGFGSSTAAKAAYLAAFPRILYWNNEVNFRYMFANTTGDEMAFQQALYNWDMKFTSASDMSYMFKGHSTYNRYISSATWPDLPYNQYDVFGDNPNYTVETSQYAANPYSIVYNGDDRMKYISDTQPILRGKVTQTTEASNRTRVVFEFQREDGSWSNDADGLATHIEAWYAGTDIDYGTILGHAGSEVSSMLQTVQLKYGDVYCLVTDMYSDNPLTIILSQLDGVPIGGEFDLISSESPSFRWSAFVSAASTSTLTTATVTWTAEEAFNVNFSWTVDGVSYSIALGSSPNGSTTHEAVKVLEGLTYSTSYTVTWTATLTNGGDTDTVNGVQTVTTSDIPLNPFTVGGGSQEIYAIGGKDDNNNSLRSVEMFDGTSWGYISSELTTTRLYHRTEALDGKIYAIGGYDSNGKTSSVEVFDTSTPEAVWTVHPQTMDKARGFHGTAVLDGKIYVFGGATDESYTDSMQVFDGASWTAGPDMTTGRSQPATAVLDGKIYAIGGSGSGNITLSSVDVFDPAEGTEGAWSPGTQMLTARRQCGAVAVGGKIYVIGDGASSAPKSMAVFDGTSWTAGPDMDTARSSPTIVAFDGKIYAIGGADGTNELRSVEVFDPDEGAWSYTAEMKSARQWFGATVTGMAPTNSIVWLNSTPTAATGTMSADEAFTVRHKLNNDGDWSAYVGSGENEVEFVFSDLMPSTTYTVYWEATLDSLPGIPYTGSETFTTSDPPPNPFMWRSLDPPLLYALGGDSASSANSVEVFDGTAWTASSFETMDHNRSFPGVAAVDGKIYAIGGVYSGTGIYQMEVLDPQTFTWETHTSYMTEYNGRYNFATAVVDGTIYVIGGSNGGTALDETQKFDTTANSPAWAKGPKMGSSYIRLGARAVGIGSQIYVVGGMRDSSNRYDSMFIGTWNSVQTLTGWEDINIDLNTKRYDHGIAVVDGKIYVTGGMGGGGHAAVPLDTVEVFDPSHPDNGWTVLPQKLNNTRCRHASAALNGKIYVAGGIHSSGGSAVDSVEVFDPSHPDNGWTEHASSMTIPRRTHSMVRLGSDLPFVVTPTTNTSVFTADVSTPVPDMDTTLVRHQTVVHNNIIYVLGGRTVTSNDSLDTMYAFNTETSTWGTSLPSMVSPRKDFSAVVVDDSIYVIGGDSVTVDIYNTETATWSSGVQIPNVRIGCCAAVVDGTIYVVGGKDSTDPNHDTYSDMLVLDTTGANTWSNNNIPHQRVDAGAVALNGKLYVMGGYTSSGAVVEEMDIYDPVSGSWTSVATDIDDTRPTIAATGNDIYIFGGFWHPTAVTTFNTDTLTWETMSNRLSKPRYGAKAAFVDDTFYLVGGIADTAAYFGHTNVERYTIAGATTAVHWGEAGSVAEPTDWSDKPTFASRGPMQLQWSNLTPSTTYTMYWKASLDSSGIPYTGSQTFTTTSMGTTQPQGNLLGVGALTDVTAGAPNVLDTDWNSQGGNFSTTERLWGCAKLYPHSYVSPPVDDDSGIRIYDSSGNYVLLQGALNKVVSPVYSIDEDTTYRITAAGASSGIDFEEIGAQDNLEDTFFTATSTLNAVASGVVEKYVRLDDKASGRTGYLQTISINEEIIVFTSSPLKICYNLQSSADNVVKELDLGVIIGAIAVDTRVYLLNPGTPGVVRIFDVETNAYIDQSEPTTVTLTYNGSDLSIRQMSTFAWNTTSERLRQYRYAFLAIVDGKLYIRVPDDNGYCNLIIVDLATETVSSVVESATFSALGLATGNIGAAVGSCLYWMKNDYMETVVQYNTVDGTITAYDTGLPNSSYARFDSFTAVGHVLYITSETYSPDKILMIDTTAIGTASFTHDLEYSGGGMYGLTGAVNIRAGSSVIMYAPMHNEKYMKLSNLPFLLTMSTPTIAVTHNTATVTRTIECPRNSTYTWRYECVEHGQVAVVDTSSPSSGGNAIFGVHTIQLNVASSLQPSTTYDFYYRMECQGALTPVDQLTFSTGPLPPTGFMGNTALAGSPLTVSDASAEWHVSDDDTFDVAHVVHMGDTFTPSDAHDGSYIRVVIGGVASASAQVVSFIYATDANIHEVVFNAIVALPEGTTCDLASFIDVSNVTDMSNLFDRDDHPLVKFPLPNNDIWTNRVQNMVTFGIGTWDVSNVTTMSNMFRNCRDFNEDISQWRTGSVTSLFDTFCGCYRFNTNINTIGDKWDVGNVTNMYQTFRLALDFNKPLSNWDTSNVTDMSRMFFDAQKFNQPIATNGNKWNVSNVRFFERMFMSAYDFNQDIGNWTLHSTYNVYMPYMFYEAYDFNQDISGWNTERVTNMQMMLYGAKNFNVDIRRWNTTNVTNFNNFENSSSSNGTGSNHNAEYAWDDTQARHNILYNGSVYMGAAQATIVDGVPTVTITGGFDSIYYSIDAATLDNSISAVDGEVSEQLASLDAARAYTFYYSDLSDDAAPYSLEFNTPVAPITIAGATSGVAVPGTELSVVDMETTNHTLTYQWTTTDDAGTTNVSTAATFTPTVAHAGTNVQVTVTGPAGDTADAPSQPLLVGATLTLVSTTSTATTITVIVRSNIDCQIDYNIDGTEVAAGTTANGTEHTITVTQLALSTQPLTPSTQYPVSYWAFTPATKQTADVWTAVAVPVVTGTTAKNNELTITAQGTVDNYAWKRSDDEHGTDAIPVGTDATYSVVEEDEWKYIAVTVTRTNPLSSATSAWNLIDDTTTPTQIADPVLLARHRNGVTIQLTFSELCTLYYSHDGTPPDHVNFVMVGATSNTEGTPFVATGTSAGGEVANAVTDADGNSVASNNLTIGVEYTITADGAGTHQEVHDVVLTDSSAAFTLLYKAVDRAGLSAGTLSHPFTTQRVPPILIAERRTMTADATSLQFIDVEAGATLKPDLTEDGVTTTYLTEDGVTTTYLRYLTGDETLDFDETSTTRVFFTNIRPKTATVHWYHDAPVSLSYAVTPSSVAAPASFITAMPEATQHAVYIADLIPGTLYDLHFKVDATNAVFGTTSDVYTVEFDTPSTRPAVQVDGNGVAQIVRDSVVWVTDDGVESDDIPNAPPVSVTRPAVTRSGDTLTADVPVQWGNATEAMADRTCTYTPDLTFTLQNRTYHLEATRESERPIRDTASAHISVTII